ncbi:LAMI_0H06414g1_1 [Lachancea mirantina]|uniref:LAMI_0H06414g1_1 n=1 Tax=Lachancea mirantina TaxID=1230905 RepID=A0A1G4KF86_9SACH|nr:LAMI_0H06414g1_1 [Lachancea mirantina]
MEAKPASEPISASAETTLTSSRFGRAVAGLPLKTQLTVNSTEILDNVATQLLRLLINGTSEKLILLTSSDANAKDSVFQALFSLFKQVRLLYTDKPLLSVENVAPGLWFKGGHPPSILKGHDAFIMRALHKANLLTYLLTITGCFHYGFSFLDDAFIEIFCPSFVNSHEEAEIAGSVGGGRLLKLQTVLYLDLKTQAYISALEEANSNEGLTEELRKRLLNKIFPDAMREFLISKRANKNVRLSPSEEDFVARSARRREKLMKQENLEDLIKEYDWMDFFKELFFHVQKSCIGIIWDRQDSASKMTSLTPNVNTPTPKSGSEIVSSSINARFEIARQRTPEREVTPGPAVKKPKEKRLWLKSEEEALVTALKTHGPAWSKILEQHGAGGSISEALRNRTQVQLKDKARNWKMYFLKSGLPVPDYLSKVTGDLERDEKSRKRSKARKNSSGNKDNRTTTTRSPCSSPKARKIARVLEVSSENGLSPELVS